MSIGDEFARLVSDDELCAEVRQAVDDGNEDALRRLGFGGFGDYAQRLSELMSNSVREGHDPKAEDFAAIMEEVARPVHYAHHLVNEAGTAVQLAKDEPLGIHIKPQEADFDDDALKSTVGNAASMDTPEKTVEALAEGLAYAVKKAGNDFIKANAEAHSRAGFEVKVKRSGSTKCCPWCAARIGSWAIANAPDGVFGCHENCSCTVEYTSSTGAKTSARGANLHRYGAGAFAEAEYQPPHVLSREEAREKGGFDEPKRLTGGANDGIINEKSNKPVIAITDNAIQNVQYISVHGYTEEQSKIIQQQHKELLKIARDKNDNFEVAIVLNRELEPSAPLFGRDNDVTFGMLNGTNLTILHNHPRGSSFSANDLEFFCKCGQVKTLTIVKNNGQVEYITKADSFNPNTLSLEYARLHKKMIKKGTNDEYDKLIKKLLTVTKSGVIWNE